MTSSQGNCSCHPINAMMHTPSTRTFSPNFILFVLCLGIFSTAIDQTVIYGALNDIMFDLHMNVTDLDDASWIVIGYLLGYAAVLPLAGRVSDIYGHTRTYIWATLLFMGASGFIIVADDLGLIIAARVLQAIGGGAIVPASLAIVGDLYPAQRRAIALGIIGGAVEMGAALGPSFGGAVSEYLGWHWIFWIDIIIGAIIIPVIYFTVRNTPGLPQRVDYYGSFLAAVSLGLLVFGLSQQLHRSNAELIMGISVAGSVACAGLFLRRLIRTTSPLFRLALFKQVRFSAANLTHFLVGGALIIALVGVPVMGYTLMGLGDVEVGLRLLRLTLAIPIGAVAGGFICNRFGYRLPTFAGLVLSCAGFLFMWRWTEAVAEPWLSVHLITCGFGFGLVISPIITAVIDSVKPGERGIASALITATRMIGMSIGLAFMNSVGMGHFHVAAADININEFEEALSPVALDLFQDFFFAGAVICLVTLLPAFWMGKRAKHQV